MYKKFTLSLFITILIFITSYWYFVITLKMYYMDLEYPMWKEVKDRTIYHTNQTIEVVMIGDSRAKAGFKPDILSKEIKSINLSVGGATPIEGYYTLKRYLKHNKAPKKLIISYTPTHLSDNDGCYFTRTVPFDFLEDIEYERVEELAYKFKCDYILHQKKSYIDYKFPFLYGHRFLNGIFNFRWLKNQEYYAYSKVQKGYHWFGQKKYSDGLNAESKKKKFIKSKLYQYYFEKLLQLAKLEKIKIYFYIMPFNKSSYDSVKQQYVYEYQKYIKNLSDKYDMQVCNKVFYMDNSEFGDSSHLYNGVQKNTHLIYECVKNNLK